MGLKLCVIYLSLIWSLVLAEEQDICQWENFKAKCPLHEVIKIEKALYGRLERGPCIEKDFGYVGCFADVKSVAEQMCAGRLTCSITVPNKYMEKAPTGTGCVQDLKGYLRISHSCMKVAKPEANGCTIQTSSSANTGHNYIASASTPSTGCGNTDMPWKIKAQKGQKINVTLHDFNTSISGRNLLGHIGTRVVYATIKDVLAHNSISVNGGQRRITHAYTSTGSELEIRVLLGSAQRQPRYFLLEYNVIGCPDLASPGGGWVEYVGTEAIVGCMNKGATWRLQCNSHQWKGDYGLCDNGEIILGPAKERGNPFRVNMPWSVIIVICVAILLGLAILGTGICILKRRKNHPYASAISRGPQPGHLKGFPPDYNADHPPPSYYSARNITPEHEYEYVSDVLQRKEPNATTMHPHPVLPGNVTMASEISNYTGTGYGTLPPPAGETQVILTNGGVTGNVYVPDNISLMSPKYFELDSSRGGPKQIGSSIQGNGPVSSGSNVYNSLHHCAQVSKQQFGHYSQ